MHLYTEILIYPSILASEALEETMHSLPGCELTHLIHYQNPSKASGLYNIMIRKQEVLFPSFSSYLFTHS